MPATATIDDLLKPEDAARILGVNEGTLAVWRSTKRYNLPFVLVGRSVRYRREDLLAWIERRRVVAASAEEVASDA